MWWDVAHYDLAVRLDPDARALSGAVEIAYRVVGPAREMQVDLQEPLVVDAVEQGGRPLVVDPDYYVDLRMITDERP